MTAKQILQKKGAFKAEMDRMMPREQSDALWQKGEERLGRILQRYSSLPKGLQMHTRDRIFPAAAIYLTLKDELGQEKAYKVIEDSAVNGCAEIAKKLRKLMKVPGMRGLFVAAWDPLTKKIFGADNGFQNVFYPKGKGRYRMDIVAITITDTFDYTEFVNPFNQSSLIEGILWAANDIAYIDTKWGLLDPVSVKISYVEEFSYAVPIL